MRIALLVLSLTCLVTSTHILAQSVPQSGITPQSWGLSVEQQQEAAQTLQRIRQEAVQNLTRPKPQNITPEDWARLRSAWQRMTQAPTLEDMTDAMGMGDIPSGPPTTDDLKAALQHRVMSGMPYTPNPNMQQVQQWMEAQNARIERSLITGPCQPLGQTPRFSCPARIDGRDTVVTMAAIPGAWRVR